LKRPVLDRGKILGKSIFRISESEKKTVVRLDATESLLRRNLKGLVFTEIEAREEEDNAEKTCNARKRRKGGGEKGGARREGKEICRIGRKNPM
jgi:hypothetical protein